MGSIANPRVWRDVPRPVSIALTDISSVAVEKTNAGLTILAVAGGMVVVFGVAYLVACAGEDSFGCP